MSGLNFKVMGVTPEGDMLLSAKEVRLKVSAYVSAKNELLALENERLRESYNAAISACRDLQKQLAIRNR